MTSLPFSLRHFVKACACILSKSVCAVYSTTHIYHFSIVFHVFSHLNTQWQMLTVAYLYHGCGTFMAHITNLSNFVQRSCFKRPFFLTVTLLFIHNFLPCFILRLSHTSLLSRCTIFRQSSVPCLSEWWLAALPICPDTLPSWIFRIPPGTIGLVTDTARQKIKMIHW